MKSIVTGGAGFIVSHLCDLFTYVQHGATKPFHDTGKADYVFHPASPATCKMCVEAPIVIMKINTEGTINMLDFAKENQACFCSHQYRKFMATLL